MADPLPTWALEWRLIYAIVVAGKNAKFADDVLKRLFPNEDVGPFDTIRDHILHQDLREWIFMARAGNYNKLELAMTELVQDPIDLVECGPERLEEIHGIGSKTSRFFILWTRPDSRYAALDVHILRWMGRQGYKVPKQTPGGNIYKKIERWFIAEADKRGMTPRELDWEIWSKGAGYKGRVQSES